MLPPLSNDPVNGSPTALNEGIKKSGTPLRLPNKLPDEENVALLWFCRNPPEVVALTGVGGRGVVQVVRWWLGKSNEANLEPLPQPHKSRGERRG